VNNIIAIRIVDKGLLVFEEIGDHGIFDFLVLSRKLDYFLDNPATEIIFGQIIEVGL
jgi:hypothetical protein